MSTDPATLMLLIVALSVLICVLVLSLPDCLEDCGFCRDLRASRDEEARKRQEDYWNGRRPRP